VAGRGLAEYAFRVVQARLDRNWVLGERDRFVAAPIVAGDVLIAQSQRPGSQALALSCFALPAPDAKPVDPELLWTVELAEPPAESPHVAPDQKRMAVVSRSGAVWNVPTEEIRSGRLDLVATRLADGGPLTGEVALADGRLVYAGASGRRILHLLMPGDQGFAWKNVAVKIPEARLAGEPIAMGDETVLLTTPEGSAYLIDLGTGLPRMLPFQPAFAPGKSYDWVRPTSLSDRLACLGNRDGNLFLIGVRNKPDPHLAELAHAALNAQPASGLVTVGETVFVVTRTAHTDAVVALQAQDLTMSQRWTCPDRLVSGPYRVGDLIAVETADHTLSVFDASPNRLWTVPLPHWPLAGPPTPFDGKWLCTASGGVVFQLSSETGEAIRWSEDAPVLDVAEPLAGSPTIVGNRLWLLGADCTIYTTGTRHATESGGADPTGDE
jgi:hypothetical protein